jgi:KDO2-lipid IV(A) lauroyltransferase
MAYRAFMAMQWVVERLPRGAAYALAIVVGRVALLTARKARRRLTFNLRRALPELSEAEIRRLVRRNFRNHAKAYIDLMQLPRADVGALGKLITLEGKTHLDAALARGKGVMVVAPHMGSWEVIAASVSANIAPFSLFAEVLEPVELYQWYRLTRARLGVGVLPLTRGGLRQVVRALEANEIVVTAIDRDVLGTGQLMDFFGHPAPIPTGPAAVALRRGAALMPLCLYRKPDDTYIAVCPPVLEVTPTGDFEADVTRVTSELLRQLEGYIREHPDQWHLPHRIWADCP